MRPCPLPLTTHVSCARRRGPVRSPRVRCGHHHPRRPRALHGSRCAREGSDRVPSAPSRGSATNSSSSTRLITRGRRSRRATCASCSTTWACAASRPTTAATRSRPTAFRKRSISTRRSAASTSSWPARRTDHRRGRLEGVADTLNSAAETPRAARNVRRVPQPRTGVEAVEGKRPMDILAGGDEQDVALQFDIGTCVAVGRRSRSRGSRRIQDGSRACTARTGRPARSTRVLFGEGVSPWAKIFEAAESTGGIEFYLIEQEAGPAEEQLQRADAVPGELEEDAGLTNVGRAEPRPEARSPKPEVRTATRVPAAPPGCGGSARPSRPGRRECGRPGAHARRCRPRA